MELSSVLAGSVVLPGLLAGVVDDPERITRFVAARGAADSTEAWALTERWYQSVRDGRPDYGVYLEDDHVADVWACWEETSRHTLRKLRSPRALPSGSVLAALQAAQPAVVVDVGCGLGLTTAVLAQWFPNAEVIGTNFPGCAQYRIAEQLADQYRFRMVSAATDVGKPADLILASEYFEHFQAPIDHLNEVIDALHPQAMIINNTFTVASIGHFPSYIVAGEIISGSRTSRLFNKALTDCGYFKQPAKLWNNRPAYWTRP